MDVFAFERRWYRVVARALVPATVLGGTGAHLDAGELFRDDCRDSPWYSALVMRAALWLVWLAPLVMSRGLRTFGRLDEGGREEVLERMLKSERYLLRTLVTFLKLECCTLVLGDRRVIAHLHAYGLRPEDEPAKEEAADDEGGHHHEHPVAR